MSKKEIFFFLSIIFLISYSWGYEIQNISNSPNLNSYYADIDIDDSGILHVVWVEQDGETSHLYYSKSTDNGINWFPPKEVAYSNYDWNYRPAIGADSSGNPHIIYNEYSVFHIASYDGGNTWSARIDISRQHEEGWSGWPRFKIDKLNRIHVTWTHSLSSFQRGVYYSLSGDNGNSWSIPLRLSEEHEVAGNSEIATDELNYPHVVWETRLEYPPMKIEYRFFNGNEWSEVIEVRSDYEHKAWPSIAIDKNNSVHIIWNQAWSDNGIYYRNFDGINWGNLEIISGDPILRESPKLNIDSSDNLVAVWQENHGFWDGEKFSQPFKIYYNSFSVGWNEPKAIEEGPLSYDAQVRIAIDDKKYAHIVWSKGSQFDFSREVFHLKFYPYPYIEILVDIKPGSFPNSINLGSYGNVPVVIFSTPDFDATTVDPTTVTLAGASVKLKGKGTPMTSFEDINEDGLLDIVVHVDTTALELSLGDTEAVLEGETYDGVRIRGTDTVRIIE